MRRFPYFTASSARRLFLPFVSALALGTFSTWSPPASASLPAGGQSLRPAASVESYIATESSQVLPAWTPSATLLTTYGQDLRQVSGDRWQVQQRTTAHLLVAFGLFDYAQLDMGLPLVAHQSGQSGDSSSTLSSATIGDLRLGAKGSIIRLPDRGLGVGVGLDLTLPTGDADSLTGETGVAGSPYASVEYRTAWGIESALNLGYTIRPDHQIDNRTIGDSFLYRLATRIPLHRNERIAAMLELDGLIGVVDKSQSPLSGRAGFRWRMKSGVVLGAYGGGAFVAALGIPSVEGMLSVGYVPPQRVGRERPFRGSPRPSATELAKRYDYLVSRHRPLPKKAPPHPDDWDGDGIMAKLDRCPQVAEDLDQFEDSDGCPEWDNDRDGFKDSMDMCPSQPEVVNGYADWDGCPDHRLADGKGWSQATFDPESILPELAFAHESTELDEANQASLVALAELFHLNPWLTQVEIQVQVPTTEDGPEGALQLAAARSDTVRNFLEEQGLESWRVRVQTPQSVPAGETESIRLALHTAPAGLRPLAPSQPELDRFIATEVEKRQPPKQLERRLGEGPDTLAQGPEENKDAKGEKAKDKKSEKADAKPKSKAKNDASPSQKTSPVPSPEPRSNKKPYPLPQSLPPIQAPGSNTGFPPTFGGNR